jgi:hypothetical protein
MLEQSSCNMIFFLTEKAGDYVMWLMILRLNLDFADLNALSSLDSIYIIVFDLDQNLDLGLDCGLESCEKSLAINFYSCQTGFSVIANF